VTLEAEPVSPGEALSGKLSGKLVRYFVIYYGISAKADMKFLREPIALIR